MGKFTFKAEDHAGRWFPLGRNDKGDEVWCDGCCIEDKNLADRIAANMEAAYQQGLKDAARDIVQQAVRIAAAGGGRIADTMCLGGWLVRNEPRDVLTDHA